MIERGSFFQKVLTTKAKMKVHVYLQTVSIRNMRVFQGRTYTHAFALVFKEKKKVNGNFVHKYFLS